ncbi:outer membrane lipoprotein-sorting protein [Petroclostridium sp. X23]|uniref:LolA family protein n=1 Tax=Petroclostridium sp. X23 TaxID=3045146 RepID=UPI0024AD4FC9|nr:outer membrane lipoprotein-sorting protein [Petroclostridium sp. X23]WHH56913.1 outer membrane lipoprotein-sorting protein [Petroclostridium sp. X23]
MKLNKMVAGILMTVLTGVLMSGCAAKGTIIPEELISKAVSAYEKPKPYYAEVKIDVYEDDKHSESSIHKEWVDNSDSLIKRRIESESDESGKMISTNDGETITIYMEKDKSAMVMKAIDGYGGNYKEQTIKDLGVISKTHEISIKGEEQVNGFDTYHLYATPKEENTIWGAYDYWIDKNNWFVVKSSVESANMIIKTEYVKLEFNPKMDAGLFVQNLPEDVKIENIEDNPDNEGREITLEEAAEIAGKHFLSVEGTSEYKLKKVTYLNFEKINHREFTQSYEKDGVEVFQLTIVIPDSKDEKEGKTERLPEESEIQVRGKTGSLMNLGAGTQIIFWEEDGLNYSFITTSPDITNDDAIRIINNLE